ncbi:hypothetical protein BABINDRAFT_162957 [Babjeviella inositovora NRRL Y-12698]|uniref:Uncharacterized protein n=1 Tax=Babjeviella inositovora NRRL Y-12698 TaxID=984486 RepID=A0A1E3QKV3_9ASCO|nr:uncharacterized protein BABINDRAFT_162957 [Babjeviella inositovora NRRL Y-12698]ODQ78313.1 hypothetical protein BABINDRAFT_162957 [Babjeviella inositovora NRRL Y-12698]
MSGAAIYSRRPNELTFPITNGEATFILLTDLNLPYAWSSVYVQQEFHEVRLCTFAA